MSNPSDPTILTRRTTANLTDKEYCLVVSSGDDDLALCGDAAAAIGALTNDVADGSGGVAKHLPVQVGGMIKVKCGGTVTAGLMAASMANGLAINGDQSNDYHFGIALESGGVNDILTFLWSPGGQEN